jgi:hypothetical protein
MPQFVQRVDLLIFSGTDRFLLSSPFAKDYKIRLDAIATLAVVVIRIEKRVGLDRKDGRS